MQRASDFSHWNKAAQYMRDTIETQGWNEEQGIYVQEYSAANPDASNLLMTAVNFNPPGDPRFTRMISADLPAD